MGQVFDTDVFVVGGGPAGLAAAIAARQHGLRVMVADRAQPPIDKACGEGLMPDSLEVLGRLGVSLECETGQGCETGSFHGIRFVGPEGSAAATFPQGHGLGIRRVLLHEVFVRHAEHCGVEMLWGARVSAIRDQAVLVNGRKISCRWLVGADGQNSQVRDWAGLSAGSGSTQRIGLRQHFQDPAVERLRGNLLGRPGPGVCYARRAQRSMRGADFAAEIQIV